MHYSELAACTMCQPVARTGWPKHSHARVGLATTSTGNDDVALGALYAADGRMRHAVPPGPRGEQHRSRVERPTAWVDARGDGLHRQRTRRWRTESALAMVIVTSI